MLWTIYLDSKSVDARYPILALPPFISCCGDKLYRCVYRLIHVVMDIRGLV